MRADTLPPAATLSESPPTPRHNLQDEDEDGLLACVVGLWRTRADETNEDEDVSQNTKAKGASVSRMNGKQKNLTKPKKRDGRYKHVCHRAGKNVAEGRREFRIILLFRGRVSLSARRLYRTTYYTGTLHVVTGALTFSVTAAVSLCTIASRWYANISNHCVSVRETANPDAPDV